MGRRLSAPSSLLKKTLQDAKPVKGSKRLPTPQVYELSDTVRSLTRRVYITEGPADMRTMEEVGDAVGYLCIGCVCRRVCVCVVDDGCCRMSCG